MNRTRLALTAVLLLGAVRLNAAGTEPPPPPPEKPAAKDAPAGPAKGGRGGADHHRFGLLKEMDTNHDGKITKEEFLARSSERSAERFAKIDANHDGSIDKTEVAAAMKKMQELRERMQKRGGDTPRRRPGTAA